MVHHFFETSSRLQFTRLEATSEDAISQEYSAEHAESRSRIVKTALHSKINM
jgi:hypothetical protein